MNTMKSSMHTSELLSALADGQLVGEDFAAALQACQQDASALDRWDRYHLIGNVLRQPAHTAAFPRHGADRAFVDRLSQRLAKEPLTAVVALDAGASSVIAGTMADAPMHPRRSAANDESFRWKLMAGLASLAAVAAIAWNASGLLALPASAPQLAQAANAPQVVVASPQGLMVRDARLEELLAAHAQLGGSSALQVPSGFLRNATFETSQNAGR